MQSPLFTALAEIARHIGKKLDLVAAAIKKDNTSIATALREQSSTLSKMGTGIAQALTRIQEPKFTGEVVVDTTQLETTVREATKAISGLAVPTVDNVEAALSIIHNDLKAQTEIFSQLAPTLTQLASVISKKEFKAPSTIKLDDMQMRQLAQPSRMALNPAPLAARNMTMKNLALTSTAVEYSYTFPANTTAWNIKLRDQGTLTYYAFALGKLPGSGDSSSYGTIPQNFMYSQENVDWSGKTMYFGAESNSQVLEITSYQA